MTTQKWKCSVLPRFNLLSGYVILASFVKIVPKDLFIDEIEES
jgi:hypothetical protein